MPTVASLNWFGISEAFAQGQGAPAPQSSPSMSFLFPLVLVFLIFYFLLIRPQQKQQKERMKMVSEIKKGDSIVTNSGIYGKVTGVTDKILTVDIADNVKIKLDRDAVARVNPPELSASYHTITLLLAVHTSL